MKNNRKLGQAVMHSRRLSNVICFGLAAVCLSAAAEACADETRRIANDTIQAVFAEQDGAWRLTQLARLDGTDALEMTSDEFEILLFDGRRFTVDAYRATGDPNVSTENGTKTFETVLRRKTDTSPLAPESVTVTYRLGAGPYLHKTVYLGMEKDGKVDRLQVLRFSTPQRATRGGEGQPVFIGNWFFGMDYPGFYSRHSDGFEEPDFNYRWHYTIDLEGRDIDAAPRDGLVTLFHFPGYAVQEADGSFGITSKRAVIGIARKPGEGAELALMDYIAQTRKPPRSNLHFNNWYPYVEEMPWKLVSGQTFEIGIPGDTTVIYEIDPGSQRLTMPLPRNALPPFTAEIKAMPSRCCCGFPTRRSSAAICSSSRGAQRFPRWNSTANPLNRIVSKSEKRGRSPPTTCGNSAGKQSTVTGRLVPADEPKLPKNGTVPMEVWLVVDRKVDAPRVPDIGPIPFPIAQDYRRQTQELIPRQTIRVR